MAWLEAHEELLEHPKTAVLSDLMGWNKYESAGRLLAFWFWSLKYAPTGDLRKFNDCQIGAAVGLNGDACSQFVKAMVSACWLDRFRGTFRVHDWPDYTKRYLRDSKFKDKPEKWKEVVAVYSVRPPESPAENSRVTPEVSAVPTNQPTNLTNQPFPASVAAGGNGKHKPPKAKKAPSGPHQALIKHFTDAWERRYGHPYVFRKGKDGSAAKEILLSVKGDLAWAKRMVNAYLGCGDPFLEKLHYPLASLDVNRWRDWSNVAGDSATPRRNITPEELAVLGWTEEAKS